MEQQSDLHKRLLIALVLSMTVLIGFSYLFPTKTPQQTSTQNATQTTQSSPTPKTTPAATTTNVKPAPVTTAAATAPATPQEPASTDADSDIVTTVTAKDHIIKIDRFGRIKSMVLLEERYKDDEGVAPELFNPTKVLPLEVRFADPLINDEAFKVPYTASTATIDLSGATQKLVLTQKLSSITVIKEIVFYPDGHFDLTVSTDKKADFFVTPGNRPDVDKSIYMLVRGALVRDANGVITTVEDEDASESVTIPNATIISAFDRYTASLFYRFDTPVSAVITADAAKNPLPFVQASKALTLHGYIGPKEWEVFKKLDKQLVDAIEFGWFTFLSKPFFAVMLWIYSYVGNWGWAIVLFTLLVKIILFPLSYKGMMSMQKLKDLSPKMKEIKERYSKDSAKMNQHMMDLYKKHNANPMGGCLPILLQIPVFFALYRVLLNADELQGADWVLWIVNLSDKDPYYILPILMGASMYLQQVITPNTIADPLQQKIFKFFPVIMTLFFLSFPSGLVLYWLTNNVLSIAQQYYINAAYEKHKLQAKEAVKQDKEKEV